MSEEREREKERAFFLFYSFVRKLNKETNSKGKKQTAHVLSVNFSAGTHGFLHNPYA
ncbi:hypothetical protein LguiA_006124 [Lonicera macranthoides]